MYLSEKMRSKQDYVFEENKSVQEIGVLKFEDYEMSIYLISSIVGEVHQTAAHHHQTSCLHRVYNTVVSNQKAASPNLNLCAEE